MTVIVGLMLLPVRYFLTVLKGRKMAVSGLMPEETEPIGCSTPLTTYGRLSM